MCGIVGYIGKKDAVQPVIDGLVALEYRGYDSAGVAYIDATGCANLVRRVGRVEALQQTLETTATGSATVAIGHTRWATHGTPTTDNAHPHSNAAQTIFAVHNGIIENYAELKQQLEAKGYSFASDTDTEVIPHLIDFHYQKTKNLTKAFEAAIKELQGAYAIAMCSTYEPDTVLAAKLSSPLVVGVGKHELFLASDPTAIMSKTNQVIFLEDYEMAILKKDSYKIHDFQKSAEISKQTQELDFSVEQTTLGDYPHFMIKEIFEGPQTIQSATRGRIRLEDNLIKLGGLENVSSQLQHIDRVVIVACGTSYYAGMVGEYLIEEIAGIPVEVQLASEFKYRKEPFSRGTAIIAISQSGETADTIAALKKYEDYGVLRLGIVNAVGSTIARITDAGVYCHAGPEQAVASTKAFIAQVTVLTLIALHLSRGNTALYKPLMEELTILPDKLRAVLDQAPTIKKLAEKYAGARDFMFLGRGYDYPCALEGALKLKEISYIHAEGYAAGELKHGPLALIDANCPSFVLIGNSELAEKTYSNIEEIRARSGPIIAIAPAGDKHAKKLADDVIFVPKTMEQTEALLIVPVLQLFSYYAAVALGHNVDRPRNLAKSVTVE